MDFLVGTYTENNESFSAKGEGIYSVGFDPESGKFDVPTLRHDCSNPSWLEISPDRNLIFAVQESFAPNNAALSSYQLNASGNFHEIATQVIQGDSPCHLAFDPNRQVLASAQYMGGNVALCQLEEGKFNNVQYIEGAGSGPNKTRQEAPHAHFVAFTDYGTVLHIADLGADKVISHKLSNDGEVEGTSVLFAPNGSGPRHLAVSKDQTRAWVICELSETVLKLSREGIGWKIENQFQAFAEGSITDGAAGAIKLSPDEKFLYVSGRSQSSIACFSSDGRSIGEFKTGGEFPRDFVVTSDGNWVVVANQFGNTLTSLKRDPVTGKLNAPQASCSVGSPVCLVEF